MTEQNLVGQEILERAQKDLISGNLDVAERAFNYLLDRNKKNPDLWFYSGTCLMQREFYSVAELMFNKCLELDAHSVAAYNNLGTLCKEQQRNEEAEVYFRKALKFFPKKCSPETEKEKAGIWNNLATLYVNNGTPDKAIEYCNNGLEYLPGNQKILWNRSLAHLEKSEWKKGWDDYESGHEDDGKRKKRDYLKVPVWDGTPGKTVIVYGEQGIGDEIMFASMIPEMSKICTVLIDCHPRLANIFRESWPDINIYGTRKEKEVEWHKLYKVDAKIAIGSLGQFFRNSESSFPDHSGYLVPDKSIVSKYKDKLSAISGRPKIGISWKGGYMKTRKDLRTVSLDQWGDIFSLDADFFSLQYTAHADTEAKKAEEQLGIKIHHWQDTIDDYDETAGLVCSLDLVISVCTSVVHLAGAMNVPCYVLTPSKPAWRYGLAGKSIVWYPSVSLYRQVGSDWSNVMKLVREDTCRLFQKSIAI